MIPGILVYVYVGTAVSSIGALFDQSGGSSLLKVIMFAVGIFFGFAAIIVICIYTKRQLNKIMKEIQDSGEVDSNNNYNDIINEIELHHESISDRGQSPANDDLHNQDMPSSLSPLPNPGPSFVSQANHLSPLQV